MWRSWSQAHDYNTCLWYLQSYKMSIVGHRGFKYYMYTGELR